MCQARISSLFRPIQGVIRAELYTTAVKDVDGFVLAHKNAFRVDNNETTCKHGRCAADWKTKPGQPQRFVLYTGVTQSDTSDPRHDHLISFCHKLCRRHC